MKYICFIFLALCLTGCIKSIDFDVPGEVQSAVILNAKIVKGAPSKLIVVGGAAQDFTGRGFAVTIVKAEMFNQTSGQKMALAQRGYNEFYAEVDETDMTFDINYTDEYYTEVLLSDGGIVRSATEKLYQVPSIIDVQYRFEPKTSKNLAGQSVETTVAIYDVETDLTDPNMAQFLRWDSDWMFRIVDLFRTECYIPENLNADEVLYDNTRVSRNGPVTVTVLEHELSSFYTEGANVNIVQESLSPSAYVYFKELKTLLDRGGSIFDTAPGKITTNMSMVTEDQRELYGYFYLTEQDSARTFVDVSNVKGQFRTCDLQVSGDRPPTICEDCLAVPRSMAIPPSWWLDE